LTHKYINKLNKYMYMYSV